jgi:hypothetical protein
VFTARYGLISYVTFLNVNIRTWTLHNSRTIELISRIFPEDSGVSSWIIPLQSTWRLSPIKRHLGTKGLHDKSIKYVRLPRCHKSTNIHSVPEHTHTRIYNIQNTHTEFPWHMSSLVSRVKLRKECGRVCGVCVRECVVCVCVVCKCVVCLWFVSVCVCDVWMCVVSVWCVNVWCEWVVCACECVVCGVWGGVCGVWVSVCVVCVVCVCVCVVFYSWTVQHRHHNNWSAHASPKLTGVNEEQAQLHIYYNKATSMSRIRMHQWT